MNALGYLEQDDANNRGDSYAMTFNVQEEFVFGPSRGEYALFRQDGKGLSYLAPKRPRAMRPRLVLTVSLTAGAKIGFTRVCR